MPTAKRSRLGSKLLEGSWHGNYHLATVATLTEQQADLLAGVPASRADVNSIWQPWFNLMPRDLIVIIDYPLDKPIKSLVPMEEFVHPSGLPSFGRFVLAVARKYVEIYKDTQHYRVWGHGFNDLYFERVTIGKDGVGELFIGS